MNKFTGIVGVFNCQGAGWCKETKKNQIHDTSPGTLTGSIRADDADLISQVAGEDWSGDSIVYAYRSGEVVRLPKGASIPLTLKVLEYELFHISPLKEITENISFAPIGLVDMFNSSGAIESIDINHVTDKNPEFFDGEISSASPALSDNRSPTALVSVSVRGCGRFGAYSSQRPLKCAVESTETDFTYDAEVGLVTLNLPVTREEMFRWHVEILV
jgi:raffinose synthase